jgi:endonuclease-8
VPEGDTIWRTARALHAALAGKTVVAFASSLFAVTLASRRLSLVGRTLEVVEARGKPCSCGSPGRVLHTHQGMREAGGSIGAAFRPLASRRAVIRRPSWPSAPAPVVEVLSPSQTAAHATLARLGPDCRSLRPEHGRRLRAQNDLEVAAALLDQTALAGIGNVYKSKILFLCKISPFTCVRDLDDATINRLVAKTRSSCTATSAPAGRGGFRGFRSAFCGSIVGPGNPAGSAGRVSSAPSRASRPARRTSARCASGRQAAPGRLDVSRRLSLTCCWGSGRFEFLRLFPGGVVVPIYEFQCQKCGKEFNFVLSVKEYEQKGFDCPGCKAEIEQLVTSTNVIVPEELITTSRAAPRPNRPRPAAAALRRSGRRPGAPSGAGRASPSAPR